jgi:hypothetical protein
MLFRHGPLTSALSGSLDSMTFTRNEGRPIIRTRQSPRRSNSPAQLESQRAIGVAQAAWLAFTEDTRNAWRSAARQITVPDRIGTRRHPGALETFASIVAFEYPLLTSFLDTNPNLCPAGIATASSERAGWLAPKTNDTITGYSNAWLTASGVRAATLQIQLPQPALVRHLKYMDPPLRTNTGPNAWTFQRKDGASWTTLYTAASTTYLDSDWHEHLIPCDTQSDTYRMNITTNQGHATQLGISEIEMYSEPPTNPGALMQSPSPTIAALTTPAGTNWSISLTLPTGYTQASLAVAVSRPLKTHALQTYNTWRRIYHGTYAATPTTILEFAAIPDWLATADAGEVLAFRVRIRLLKLAQIWLPGPPSVIAQALT